MTDKIISDSIAETKEIAIRIAKILKIGDVLFLSGPLGSGKTTLAKYIISTLTKLSIDNITSPTFNIVKRYRISNDASLFHMDLYNLTSKDQVEEIGLLSFFDNNITIVEWPALIEDSVKNHYELRIFMNNNSREFYLGNELRQAIDEFERK